MPIDVATDEKIKSILRQGTSNLHRCISKAKLIVSFDIMIYSIQLPLQRVEP
jgi:hypothetical protein